MQASKSVSDVAFREGRRLSADPNICAVGHGAKIRSDGSAKEGCLIFFVREKLSSSFEMSRRGTWAVPADVDGFETDVVEVGAWRAASADVALPAGNRGTRIDDPLIGGVATMALGTAAAEPAGYGTLGGICFDNAMQGPLVLSNAHVWDRTAGVEIVQPIFASTVFGAAVSPAVSGVPPMLVRTRMPTALGVAVAFANSFAQTYLVAGADDDPLAFGQAATPVSPATRTDFEQVSVSAPPAGLPPAGRRIAPVVSWAYQRTSTSAVLQASSAAARTPTKLLAARRLFTNAASYSSGQTVNLYAEILPAPGGVAPVASSHFPLVYLYPLPSGDRTVMRLLRPTSRQTPTTVTTSFQGFPAPARVGPVRLPVVVGSFCVDADQTGASFQTPPPNSVPSGSLVLRLPSSGIRLFVPPSTRVEIDIDLAGSSGTLQAVGVNTAGDAGGIVSSAPGPSGRTIVTVASSEIVEVRLSGVGGALLFGVTSRRASPETAPPLSYAGSVDVASLAKGRWGASLFVQALDSGAIESANVVETAIGTASLISDCLFDVV